MKRLAFALLLLAALVGGYLATSRALRPPAALTTEDKLNWLAREFSLGPAEVAEVRRIQTEYGPICARHCADIAAAETALRAASTPTARLDAEAKLERLQKACAEATLAHLRSISARMPPGEGERFLKMMESRIAHAPGRIGAPELAPASAP
jgi:hypothetical protein